MLQNGRISSRNAERHTQNDHQKPHVALNNSKQQKRERWQAADAPTITRYGTYSNWLKNTGTIRMYTRVTRRAFDGRHVNRSREPEEVAFERGG